MLRCKLCGFFLAWHVAFNTESAKTNTHEQYLRIMRFGTQSQNSAMPFEKGITMHYCKEVASNQIAITSDTTLMLDLMQVLFNVLPDTCVQVSVPTNKDAAHKEND